MKGFISRQRLAELLDLKTATLGSWDRHGRGVGGRGPVYLSATSVVYRIEDVEAFLQRKVNLPPTFVSPQEQGARHRGVSESASEPRGRPRRRAPELGGSEVPTTSTAEGVKESASVIATEREGKP